MPGFPDPSSSHEFDKNPDVAESSVVSRPKILASYAVEVAEGRMAVPTDLSPKELDVLVSRVRELRRARLWQYIVECIASDIVRANKHGESRC